MKNNWILGIPWIASIFATLGSLYFSEIKGFIPCTLCWYQRILMYPLIVLFYFGFVKKDPRVFLYTLPLSGFGILIALYHYGVQKIDFLNKSSTCNVGVPCTGEYINWLGFITIPFLSLIAFAIIFISSIYILKKHQKTEA